MARRSGKLKTNKALATTAAARKAALKASSGVPDAKFKAGPEPVVPINSKSRKHRKGVSIYMHPLAKEVLDKLSRDHQRSRQDLCLDALNLLFCHYGEKPIA